MAREWALTRAFRFDDTLIHIVADASGEKEPTPRGYTVYFFLHWKPDRSVSPMTPL